MLRDGNTFVVALLTFPEMHDAHGIFSFICKFFTKSIMLVVSLVFVYLSLELVRFTTANVENELANVKLFYYASSIDDVDVSEVEQLPHLNPQKPLKVIIHGWNANRHQLAMTPVQNAYLTQNKHNILAADWGSISSKPYSTARELTRALGYRIGSILSAFMIRMNITTDQVHVVGHSLGAHIAGNVGKYFRGTLSRITALDPAGPLFLPLSTDAIDKSDARFVDAIHSDIVLGEAAHRAHIDFYPNRGSTSQPGCELLDVVTLHACSHYRAPAFFAESILVPGNFVAYECRFEKILRSPSECMPAAGKLKESKIASMGEFVDQRLRGTYYLRTSRLPPYGIGNRTFYESMEM